eukprot:247251-Chlamydomonas_euryale.AAC.9
MVHGAWRTVHGARCMVHDARCMAHGAWCMAHGAWCMVVHRALCVAHGTWQSCAALGILCLAHGVLCSANVVLCIAHGAQVPCTWHWRPRVAAQPHARQACCAVEDMQHDAVRSFKRTPDVHACRPSNS